MSMYFFIDAQQKYQYKMQEETGAKQQGIPPRACRYYNFTPNWLVCLMEKTKRRFIIFIVLFVLLTCALGIIFWPFIKKLQNPEYREIFTTWVEGLGIWGALILLGIQVLQIVVAVIPGGPIELIAGAAYGPWGGLLILELGCAIATMTVFFLVRKFGLPLITRFFGADAINTWGFLKDEKKTSMVTFILFLIPGTPKDTLSYLAPLSRLTLVQFTLISILARFPGMVISVVMGNAAIKGKWLLLVLLFGLTAIIGIVGIQFRDKVIRRFSPNAGSTGDLTKTESQTESQKQLSQRHGGTELKEEESPNSQAQV